MHDGQYKYVAEAKTLRPDFAYADVADASSYVIDENPDGWVDAVQAATRAAGVPERHVHHERFAW